MEFSQIDRTFENTSSFSIVLRIYTEICKPKLVRNIKTMNSEGLKLLAVMVNIEETTLTVRYNGKARSVINKYQQTFPLIFRQ